MLGGILLKWLPLRSSLARGALFGIGAHGAGVSRGEVVVLIGASGSGKTTFIRCINLLEDIQGGRIRVNGRAMGYRERADGSLVRDSERNIARQRRDIGMVFQRFNLFPHMTALENIIEAPIQVLGTPRAEALEQARVPAH